MKVLLLLLLTAPCFAGDDYIDYCLKYPDHKAFHVIGEMAGSAGLYGLCRSAFDDGQKWAVTLDDCRKITFIMGTLTGAWVEGIQIEGGERTDFAIRDILIFNTLGILGGIALVDILAPLNIEVESNRLTYRF